MRNICIRNETMLLLHQQKIWSLLSDKTKFLLKNLLRGITWLAIIISVFLAYKKFGKAILFEWLEPMLSQPHLVFAIFLTSEIVFGIIPPEVFVLWALRGNSLIDYAGIVMLLAALSYGSGIIGFFIGRYLKNTRFYRILRYKRFYKYEAKLREYGLYLIIVAALTPLPYSAISMLVGAVRFPFKKFVFYSLTRFIRFATYSWIIWEANLI